MARPLTCHSPCCNSPSIGKDEFAGAALTESIGNPIATHVVSRALTPAPATAPAVAISPDKKLFKQFIKAYLEAQVPGWKEVDPESCK